MAIHVVRSGETLWAISNFYGVSISSIVRDNGLMSIDLIVPGLPYIFQKIGLHFINVTIKLKREIDCGC